MHIEEVALHYLPLAAIVVIGLGAMDASFRGTALGAGITHVIQTIGRACGIAPDSVWTKVVGVGGLTAVSIFIPLVLGHVGDWMLPRLACLTAGLGDSRVEWTLEAPKSWRDLVWQFRNEFSWPEGNKPIADDEDRWEGFKVEIGRLWIRELRTIAMLGALMLLAGVVTALGMRRRWRWNMSLAGIGLVVFLLASFSWATREGIYIERIVSRYRSLLEQKSRPMTPDVISYLDATK